MSNSAWEKLGYAALAVMTFICTLIAVRWTIAFVTWSGIDSGWAQVIGSIGAILGAFVVARYHANGTERQRIKESLDRNVEQAVICSWIANDVLACLSNIEGKMEDRLQGTGAPIGVERLIQLQQNLLTFASRDLKPILMAEIILLQREVAYTQTALLELAGSKASEFRFERARRRTKAVQECKDRLDARVRQFRHAAESARP